MNPRVDDGGAGRTPPWEDASLPLHLRFGRTLGDALRPVASAESLRGTALGPAIAFALLTALPLALLRGVVPYTHHVYFGPSFAVRLQGAPSTSDLVLDVARAAGLSLLEIAVVGGAVMACHASLARAYGDATAGRTAVRTVLYRAFLLPLSFGGIPSSLIAWGVRAGSEITEPLLAAFALVELLPLMLFFIALRNAARLAGDVPVAPSYAAAILPVILMILSADLTHAAIRPLLPEPSDGAVSDAGSTGSSAGAGGSASPP